MFAVTPPQVGTLAEPPITCDFKKAAEQVHRVPKERARTVHVEPQGRNPLTDGAAPRRKLSPAGAFLISQSLNSKDFIHDHNYH